MLQKIWLTFILALLSPQIWAQGLDTGSQLPQPRVGFSPSRFELAWDGRGATQSLTVLNVSDELLSIRVALSNWDLDDNNLNRTLPPSEQSLDQWMIVNPLNFTIEPGSQQTVRFAIRPRVQPEPGEHRAMIYLEEQPDPDATEAMKVSFRFGLPVYLHVGDIHRVGELHSVSLIEGRPPTISVDFESTGTAYARLDAHYAIWPEGEYPGDGEAKSFIVDTATLTPEDQGKVTPVLVRLPGTPVLPGYRRTINAPVQLPQDPGKYIMGIAGKMGDIDLWHMQAFSR